MLLILRHPQFRLLWTSGAIGGLGAIMFMMAHGWLALTVSNSPFWVGASAGMGGLGLVCFSTLGGVLADRVSRRRLVIGGGLAQAGMALLLAVLILTDSVRLWQVLAVALAVGVVDAVRLPAFLALTVDVVGRSQLLKATAANFAAVGVAGMIAPLAAGALVSNWGIEWVYVAMCGSYLVGTAVLLRLADPSPATNAQGAQRSSPWLSLKQGARYVVTTPAVRTLILMQLVGEMFGWAHIWMMPVMARDVLDVGASGLGYLLSASFAGMLVTTLTISSVGDFRDKGRSAVIGYGGFGLLLVLFAASRYFPLSLVLIAAAYAVEAVYEATVFTLVQSSVPDEMRGRIASFQTTTWGLTGVSGFHTGAIASRVGAPLAIAIGGGVVLLNAIRLWPSMARGQRLGSGE
jgi:MFS family permease